jgi:hypothetical protein
VNRFAVISHDDHLDESMIPTACSELFQTHCWYEFQIWFFVSLFRPQLTTQPPLCRFLSDSIFPYFLFFRPLVAICCASSSLALARHCAANRLWWLGVWQRHRNRLWHQCCNVLLIYCRNLRLTQVVWSSVGSQFKVRDHPAAANLDSMNAAVVQYHEVANEFRTQLKKLGLVCDQSKKSGLSFDSSVRFPNAHFEIFRKNDLWSIMICLIGVIVSCPHLNSLITVFSMVSKQRLRQTKTKKQTMLLSNLTSNLISPLENVPKKNNVFAINGICM